MATLIKLQSTMKSDNWTFGNQGAQFLLLRSQRNKISILQWLSLKNGKKRFHSAIFRELICRFHGNKQPNHDRSPLHTVWARIKPTTSLPWGACTDLCTLAFSRNRPWKSDEWHLTDSADEVHVQVPPSPLGYSRTFNYYFLIWARFEMPKCCGAGLRRDSSRSGRTHCEAFQEAGMPLVMWNMCTG